MKEKLTFKELIEKVKTETEENKEFYTVTEDLSKVIETFVNERNSKKYTQRDLARISGVKQSAIARLESLQAIPRVDTLMKLGYHLGIKLEFKKRNTNMTQTHLWLHYNTSDVETFESDLFSENYQMKNQSSMKQTTACYSYH